MGILLKRIVLIFTTAVAFSTIVLALNAQRRVNGCGSSHVEEHTRRGCEGEDASGDSGGRGQFMILGRGRG